MLKDDRQKFENIVLIFNKTFGWMALNKQTIHFSYFSLHESWIDTQISTFYDFDSLN